MTGIVWLASYPKSGNTWLRALLTNAFGRDDRPAHINSLLGHPGAASRKLFDDWSGIKSSDLTNDEISCARPRVYEALAHSVPYRVYSKVHDAFSLTPSGEPLFPRAATAGVIYVVRHPADVAASYAHHRDITPEQAEALLLDSTHRLADDIVGVEGQLAQELGSWCEHVASWLDSPLPVHLVRYEDMHRDTFGTLKAILRFLGEDITDARIAQAVEFSDFQELKRQEAEGGFFESPSSRRAFFRSGETSASPHLPTQTYAHNTLGYRDVLHRCGYQGVP